MGRQPTWRWLAAQEPRLLRLERDIRAVRDDRRKRWFCANWHWYGYGYGDAADALGFKGRLCRLVGWDASNRALRTMEAYDVATDHLYALLPNCRNCDCG